MSTAVAAAAALVNTSDSEIFGEIRQFSPTLQLYRGHDLWWKFEFAGRDYWFAPDLGGKLTKHPVTGQMVPGDGILRVSDTYGRTQDKLKRTFTGAVGLLEGQEVSAIIRFALNNHGQAGVVWLHGDEKDEARRKASRTLVRNFNKAWAEQQVESRAGFIENFKKLPKNAGRRVPSPSNDQRRAQRYLDSLAEEGAEGFEYVCEHGCSDFDNFDDYARHMKVQHRTDVPAPGAPVPEPVVPAPLLATDEDEDGEPGAVDQPPPAAPTTAPVAGKTKAKPKS